MKILQIICCAYRATTEEQDDTVVWLSHAMKGAGAELDVLLSGDAVNYTVAAQSAEGLAFGDWVQTQPPRLARDVSALIGEGVEVFAVTEDVLDRGLDEAHRIDGFRQVSRSDLPALFDRYDQVWRW